MASLRPQDRVSLRRFSGKNPHQTNPALTHLNATLTSHLTSVDSKQFTANLNPPESTLTKNIGEGGVTVNLP
jgi:hypothetical protein